jgi:hypothetical protein
VRWEETEYDDGRVGNYLRFNGAQHVISQINIGFSCVEQLKFLEIEHLDFRNQRINCSV